MRNVTLVNKRSLWGYRGDDWIPFIRIEVHDQRSLPKIRDKSYPFGFRVVHVLMVQAHPRIFERGECHFNDLFKADNVSTYGANSYAPGSSLPSEQSQKSSLTADQFIVFEPSRHCQTSDEPSLVGT